MPLVQDQSFDLVTSSPAHYHSTMDAPNYYQREISLYIYTIIRTYRVGVVKSGCQQHIDRLACLDVEDQIRFVGDGHAEV